MTGVPAAGGSCCWRFWAVRCASARRSSSSASANASPRSRAASTSASKARLVMGAMSGYAVSYLERLAVARRARGGCVGVSIGAAARLDLQLCLGSTTSPSASRSCCSASGSPFTSASPSSSPRRRNLPVDQFRLVERIAAVCRTRSKSTNYSSSAWCWRRCCCGRSAAHALGPRILRIVGESADAARAIGYSVNWIRMLATCAGGFLAGIGGSFLSLYYPGSWNERSRRAARALSRWRW